MNLRVTHIFGSQPQRGAGPAAAAGAAASARAARAGVARRAAEVRASSAGGGGPLPTRSVLNASLGFRQSSSSNSSTFPTIGGTGENQGWNLPVSWLLTKGRIINTLTVTYNRNSARSSNLYAFNTNVAGAAGIEGVSTDPFDWGIPGMSFTTIADLRDRTPSERVDQRIADQQHHRAPVRSSRAEVRR